MHRVVQKQTNGLLLASAALLISLVLTGCSAFAPAKPVNAQTPQPAPVSQSTNVSRPLTADVVPSDLDTQSGATDVIAITDPANFASSARQTAARETSTDAPDELDRPSVVSAFARAVYFRHASTFEQAPSTSGGTGLTADTPDEQDLPTNVADAIDTRQIDPAEETASTLHYTDLWDRLRSGLRCLCVDRLCRCKCATSRYADINLHLGNVGEIRSNYA